MAQYRLRFHAGRDSGRFVWVVFGESSQPVKAIPVVNPSKSTVFCSRTRARWARVELARRGQFSIEVDQVRVVAVEKDGGERAQRASTRAAVRPYLDYRTHNDNV